MTWRGFIAAFTFAVTMLANGFASPAHAQDQSSPAQHNGYSDAAEGRLSMLVNLRTQWAYVYRGDLRIASTPISSGRRGYRTPTGTFYVLQKDKNHRSNKYHNARMPFMQRLSWSGLALHAGSIPGHPASHGCVRLPTRFARWLYQQPTMGMRVLIQDDQSPPAQPDGGSDAVVASMDAGQHIALSK